MIITKTNQNCSPYPTHVSFHLWTKSNKSTTWTRRNSPEPNFDVVSASIKLTPQLSESWRKIFKETNKWKTQSKGDLSAIKRNRFPKKTTFFKDPIKILFYSFYEYMIQRTLRRKGQIGLISDSPFIILLNYMWRTDTWHDTRQCSTLM